MNISAGIGVGDVRDAKGVQDFDHGGKSSKRGENPPRVDWRAVGHVVQHAAKDVVVGEFDERPVVPMVSQFLHIQPLTTILAGNSRGKVYEALRSDINGDVIVVPGLVKTARKTGDEYGATERIQRCYFKAFVLPGISRVSLHYAILLASGLTSIERNGKSLSQ